MNMGEHPVRNPFWFMIWDILGITLPNRTRFGITLPNILRYLEYFGITLPNILGYLGYFGITLANILAITTSTRNAFVNPSNLTFLRPQVLQIPWSPVGLASHICPVTALAPQNLHMARAKLVRAKVNFKNPANLADGF